MKHRLTIGIGLVLSILLLVYALRDVSAAELLEHLGDANLWWLLAATAVATLTFAIRAIRWRVLLLPAAGEISFSSRFATVCIGFMANNLLPARLGEFARAYSLSRIEPVEVSTGLASLVVERLLDALVLMTFIIPAYLLGVADVTGPGPLRQVFIVLIVSVSLGLVVAGAMVRIPGPILRFVAKWSHRLGPETLADRLTGLIGSFITGLGALRHGHVFVSALFWSVLVWANNAFSFYLGFLAFGMDSPGVPGAMLTQTVIGFAVAIPSTPGFFGPFEAAARITLELYDIAPARIISFAAGYHIMTFIPVTLLGIWYMRKLGISRDEIGHSEELVEEAVQVGDE